MTDPTTAGAVAKCPKCGADKPNMRRSSDREVVWLRCRSCAHEGPLEWTEEKAVTAWNEAAIIAATAAPGGGDVVVRMLLQEALDAPSSDLINTSSFWDRVRAALSTPAPAAPPAEPFVWIRPHDARALAMPASRWRDGVRIYRSADAAGEGAVPLYGEPALRAVLAALPEAPARCEGEGLREATPEMLDAGRFAYKDGVAGKRGISRDDVQRIWSAMKAALRPATETGGAR